MVKEDDIIYYVGLVIMILLVAGVFKYECFNKPPENKVIYIKAYIFDKSDNVYTIKTDDFPSVPSLSSLFSNSNNMIRFESNESFSVGQPITLKANITLKYSKHEKPTNGDRFYVSNVVYNDTIINGTDIHLNIF